MKSKMSIFVFTLLVSILFQQIALASDAGTDAVLEAKKCMNDRLKMVQDLPGVAYSTTQFASDLAFTECTGGDRPSLMSKRSSNGLEMVSKIRIMLLAAWLKKHPDAKIDPVVKGKVTDFLMEVKPDNHAFKLYTIESDDKIKHELALIRPVLVSLHADPNYAASK